MLVAVVGVLPLHAADAYDLLRLRWRDVLTGGTNLDLADPDIIRGINSVTAAGQSVWNSMDKSPARAALWSDLAGMATNSAHITSTYDRLRNMALAHATRGGGLETNAALRADLVGALDWMNASRYSKTSSEYGNWWDWEIGSPLHLNDITVLLHEYLSATQIANYMDAVNHFTPSPTLTAANRVWQCTVVGVRGTVVKDSAKLASARDGLTSVFATVTSGDGFYADGSFIQHDSHPYTGGYGNSLLANLAPLMFMLDGSAWQVTTAGRTNVQRWVHASFQPLIYRGAMMDMVRGREISRAGSWDHTIGGNAISSILRVSQFSPSNDAAAFKSMVKDWIQTDTARDFIDTAKLPFIPLAKALLADTNIPSRGELTGHFQFPRMDRVVHLRPGFAAGLSMSSSRTANYESLNNENVHGWFTGEGMLHLYNGDLAHHGGDFWPTVNPYRLPGTTVDVRTRADASGESYLGAYSWVGGAALLNFGVAGMQLDAWSSTLTAKKSWFFFDDEIVALGAGITSTDSRPIETIVENRRLNDAGNNPFTVDGVALPVAMPWSNALPNVAWAHLQGSASGADIGYFFPQRATLRANREARTNSWYSINQKSGSKTIVSRNYLAAWLSHGSNPANSNYAYVLLPNRPVSEVAAYAAAPDVIVVENSARAQTVRETRLGITAANFWSDGSYTSSIVTVDKKSSVIVQNFGVELEIGVSDPNQPASKSLNVEIATPAVRLLSADTGITVTTLAPRLKLAVNLGGMAGRSKRARFEVQPLKLNVAAAATNAVRFSWPSNYTGSRLQVQTNPAGIGTNWMDLPGGTSNPLVLPFSTTNGGIFFRVRTP